MRRRFSFGEGRCAAVFTGASPRPPASARGRPSLPLAPCRAPSGSVWRNTYSHVRRDRASAGRTLRPGSFAPSGRCVDWGRPQTPRSALAIPQAIAARAPLAPAGASAGATCPPSLSASPASFGFGKQVFLRQITCIRRAPSRYICPRVDRPSGANIPRPTPRGG